VIDCDVHQNFNSLQDLLPWIDPPFRPYLERGGYTGYQLPNYPWVHVGGFMMGDSVPENGGVPGSDYDTLRRQLLDAHEVEYAILTGEDILNVSCMPHPQLAAAIATAYNRWLIDDWLPRDERLKGSMVVATQDAERAAAEIRAVGDHPDVVQIIVGGGAVSGYGDPRFLPIWQAATDMGLPVAVHVGGEGLGITPPPSATGYPAYYAEWHTLLPTVVQSHLVSLICHGVFERLPEMRLVIVETGVAWLPGLLWRLEANWKALRAEIPWVKRPPSEIVAEQCWFTTQPLEQPARGRYLHQVLETIDGLQDRLMFATDYPHWDFDTPRLVERRLPKEWRAKAMSENARGLYGLAARTEPVASAGQAA
jgi:predicted TIM-barrel fold metal-dependent hydrolase